MKDGLDMFSRNAEIEHEELLKYIYWLWIHMKHLGYIFYQKSFTDKCDN